MNTSSIVVQLAAKVLAAPIAVIAVALLVRGAGDIGDGFSAGAVAALGVVLHGLSVGAEAQSLRVVRWAAPIAVGGLLGALAIAAIPLAFGDPLLTHAPEPGSTPVTLGALKLTSAVALDAAITCIVFGTLVALIAALARTAREVGAGEADGEASRDDDRPEQDPRSGGGPGGRAEAPE
ncbi:MAG: MnhB domain-containing protein [Solirubrobacterales bacterium]